MITLAIFPFAINMSTFVPCIYEDMNCTLEWAQLMSKISTVICLQVLSSVRLSFVMLESPGAKLKILAC